MACKVLSLSCWYVIFAINVSEQRYVLELGRDGVMFVCIHVYDVALCGNTIRNMAVVSDWLATPGIKD